MNKVRRLYFRVAAKVLDRDYENLNNALRNANVWHHVYLLLAARDTINGATHITVARADRIIDRLEESAWLWLEQETVWKVARVAFRPCTFVGTRRQTGQEASSCQRVGLRFEGYRGYSDGLKRQSTP